MKNKTTKRTRKSLQASAGSKQQLSFLPEPDFNPKIPSKNTFTYRVLSKLLQGKKITQPMFLREKDSWRLSVPIDILRNKLGWPVEDEDVIYRATKKPKKRIISRYFLSPDIIKKFREMGGVL